MLGYANKVDFQGVAQWIYGNTLSFEDNFFTGIPWDEWVDVVPNMAVEGDTLSWNRRTGNNWNVVGYRVYVFTNSNTTDPADAIVFADVPSISVPRGQAEFSFGLPMLGLPAGTYYIRMQARVAEYFVNAPGRPQHGMMWGSHSDLTNAVVSFTVEGDAAVVGPVDPDAINVTIDGQAVVFADQGPIIVEGNRTLVPVRAVFEAIGFTVGWEQETLTATLSRGEGELIVITVGESTFSAETGIFVLDAPAQLIEGRILLPIRAILESVGYTVGWDEQTRTVVVTSG